MLILISSALLTKTLLSPQSKSAEKDKDEEVSSGTSEAIKDCVYATVGQAWPANIDTQGR